jgi:hypothetical protein
MRFVVTGEWTRNGLLKLVIAWFLLFVFLLWCTNALIFFDSMGFSVEAVLQHYLGKTDAWGGEPVARSYKVFLAITHGHLMMVSLLLLTLTHLVLFAEISSRLKAYLVSISFASALLNEASGWLIVYVSEVFAYLKIAMFTVFQASVLIMLALLTSSLLKKQSQPNH